MLFVKDLKVCVLILKRKDSIIANYPETYKEKGVYLVFSQST